MNTFLCGTQVPTKDVSITRFAMPSLMSSFLTTAIIPIFYLKGLFFFFFNTTFGHVFRGSNCCPGPHLCNLNHQRKGQGISLTVTKTFCCRSVAQSRLTLCDPMDSSTPGLHVPHHLLEFSQLHIHYIGDAIQPSHSLMPSSPSTLNLSQHQGLFH